MLPDGVTVARSHGERESFRHCAVQGESVNRIQLWSVVVVLIGSAGVGTAAAAASMRCRIGQQAWSPCRMVADSPGQRWVLTWDQQRVEFVHDGTGQMMMRVGLNEAWRQVQPFWTAESSLCWGAVCANGAIPLE